MSALHDCRSMREMTVDSVSVAERSFGAVSKTSSPTKVISTVAPTALNAVTIFQKTTGNSGGALRLRKNASGNVTGPMPDRVKTPLDNGIMPASR